MSQSPYNISKLFDRLAEQGLDALSPDDVARLEAAANANPALEARLARLTPVPEPIWQTLPPMPDDEQWDAMWARVHKRSTPQAQPVRRRLTLRTYLRPIVAAAACVLLALVWNTYERSETSAWPVEWAHQVEINNLEVPEGETAFVLTAGEANEIPVIWVLNTQG